MSSSSARRGRADAACCSSSRRRPGAGKTTLVERLVEQTAASERCRARTRRGRRAQGETDGVDYNFVTPRTLRGDGRGRRVPRVGRRLRQPLRDVARADTERLLEAGDDVVLVIDVQGARKVRRARHRDDGGVRDAAVLRRCSSSGCAAAARTARRRSSAGCRWRGTRSPRLPSTTSSSSTTR